MFVRALGLNVFYQRQTGKRGPVLILHGWGCSTKTTYCIFDYFARLGFDTVAIDFPGFGNSDAPPENFTVYDYAKVVEEVIAKLFSRPPSVIAHSFGGRVALILASENKIDKLIITGGAGMKPRRSLKYHLKVALYKLKKKVGLNTKKDGSPDYRALAPNMKKVFLSVVNTHLENTLRKIKNPVLLIWGEKDRETPLYMARRMKRGIKDCDIVVLKGCSHFAFLENPKTFLLVSKTFLEGDV